MLNLEKNLPLNLNLIQILDIIGEFYNGEVRGSIEFLGSQFVESPYLDKRFLHIRMLRMFGDVYLYFKAKKVTNEAQTLKFGYKTVKKQANTYILKVNVN